MTKLIETHTDKSGDGLATATTRSSIFEDLLQGLNVSVNTPRRPSFLRVYSMAMDSAVSVLPRLTRKRKLRSLIGERRKRRLASAWTRSLNNVTSGQADRALL